MSRNNPYERPVGVIGPPSLRQIMRGEERSPYDRTELMARLLDASINPRVKPHRRKQYESWYNNLMAMDEYTIDTVIWPWSKVGLQHEG